MSRYYNIVITNPATGKVVQPYSNGSTGSSGAAAYSYSSYVNGQTLPSAMDVEFDVPVTAFHVPDGAAYIRIWGVSKQEIWQASDLSNFSITVSAGFQSGLPLNNPRQAGVILQGTILQPFGNWVGTDMSLDLVIAPPFGSPSTPVNLVTNWSAGSGMGGMISNALTTAFPSYTSNVNVSPNLVRSNQEIGYYESLEQFSSYVYETSRSILGASYPGVHITNNGSTFNVYDGTVPSPSSSNPKQILFKDLIGQPTWIAGNTIQFRCPMRADIQMGNFVKMPQGTQNTTTQASASNLTDLKATFAGTFLINKVRHTGRYRQVSGDAWVTVFDATTTPVPR